MGGWRGTRRVRERFVDLLHGRDDAVLWLAIALLIVATFGHYGGRSRNYDYAMLAMTQARSSYLSIENMSGGDVIVLAHAGNYTTGYRLASGATQPFPRFGDSLRVVDPASCATITTLAFGGSGSVVLHEGGKIESTTADLPGSTAFLDADITYACTGRVRAETPAVAHPGTIVGIGDDRLWSSRPDGSVVSFLPRGLMPLGAVPLPDGRWLVSTTTGWNGLNAGVHNRWLVEPATSVWTSFRDDLASVAFSPDGRWAAFIGRGSDRSLRLAPAEELTAIPDKAVAAVGERVLAADVDSFSWSPDSSRILITSGTSPNADTVKVELVDLAGNRVTLIAQASAAVEPRWSPDARRLVVGVTATDGWAANRLLILDTSGTRIGSIDHSGEELGNPVFSPDGSRLAFDVIRYPYPNNAQVGQLMIAAADGSNPVASIDWLLGAGAAVWSPDGTAFVVDRMEETGPEQMVMGFVDGRPPKPLAESVLPLVWLP